MRPVVKAGRAGSEPFPQSALDSAANVNDTAMPYTAQLWISGGSSDNAGDVSEGFSDGGTAPARIGPIGSGTLGSPGGDRISEASTHVVTFGRAVNLKMSDEVEIAGIRYAVTAHANFGALESGRRYEVRAV